MTFVFCASCSSFNSGVCKKVRSQVHLLKKLGINVHLVLIGRNFEGIYSNNSMTIIDTPKKYSNHIIKTIITHYAISKSLNYLIQQLGKDDIFYYRSLPPILFYWNVFRKRRKCKVVHELHAIEINEVKMVCGRLFYFIYSISDLIFGNLIRKRIDGFVAVTPEIAEYELKKLDDKTKSHLVLGNGINVDEIPLKKVTPFTGSDLHILCLAQFAPYHGFDRLLDGLNKYHVNIKITIHFVGAGYYEEILKKLSNKYGIEKNVIFHGYKTGKSLDDLFNQSHIAVGSLGIHRKGLGQTSELKAREYCARGIPYIIACCDPDFPDDFPYILRLRADESPIDMDRVIAFASRVYQDMDHPQKMRQYALEQLDLSIKMKKLTEFLEELVKEDNTKKESP